MIWSTIHWPGLERFYAMTRNRTPDCPEIPRYRDSDGKTILLPFSKGKCYVIWWKGLGIKQPSTCFNLCRAPKFFHAKRMVLMRAAMRREKVPRAKIHSIIIMRKHGTLPSNDALEIEIVDKAQVFQWTRLIKNHYIVQWSDWRHTKFRENMPTFCQWFGSVRPCGQYYVLTS